MPASASSPCSYHLDEVERDRGRLGTALGSQWQLLEIAMSAES
jgi:hypothetical protein